jgi:DNA-directed RNA polymerase specialized sigma subunit
MYYEDGETIENIADMMKIDVSTVVRNKKKLCLKIYDEIN